MGAVYRVELVHRRKAFALNVLHGAASRLTVFLPLSVQPYATERRLAIVDLGHAAVIVFVGIARHLDVECPPRTHADRQYGLVPSVHIIAGTRAQCEERSRLACRIDRALDDSATPPVPQPSAEPSARRSSVPGLIAASGIVAFPLTEDRTWWDLHPPPPQ